jgi:predicted dehydrogenase/threonine dehydrogenase-like Zn-dependent dehydrogenase
MKQVLIGRDGVTVEEVAPPTLEPGHVLVRVSRSCISVGTEMSGVKATNLPLWKRALRRPDQVRRVVEMVRTQGLERTVAAVRGKLDALHPVGYSAVGTVAAVGAGIDDLAVGDRVACAGSQSAFHAAIVRVPRNLAVPVPDGLDDDAAATVTLGAIALQGVRRAAPTLGETFVVVGLGLLGQLTVQLLKANGCRVLGGDLDAARIAQAGALGLDAALAPEDDDSEAQVARLTGGIGADGVIVTAASAAPELLNTAFRMCRRKGRVVLVGDVPMHIDRADIYAKELDFLISTSYGPGRYDRAFEERGLDYPVGYLRWTETRNMGAYLDLLAEGRVTVAPMIEATYDIAEAPTAYAALSGGTRPLAVLLRYPAASDDPAAAPRRAANPQARPGRDGALRLAVIGPGGFAQGTLLPIVRSLPRDYTLRAVVARGGHTAHSVASQTGAAYSATDVAEVLADPEVDAVLIATRHDLHASLVLRALRAGKHVFVEKPLALTTAELAEIEAFYTTAGDGPPVLLTGFNRRFSRYVTTLAKAVAARSNPLILDYRVNAGHIPADHWVHGPEGGGRNRGEACHFYDVMTAVTGARAIAVQARAIRPATGHYLAGDNFVATVGFDDGSLATLTYTALGAPGHPKERVEAYCDGKVFEIDDYTAFRAAGTRLTGPRDPAPDKGHREELEAFARAVRHGGAWPIPLWQQVQATRIALEVEAAIGPPPGSAPPDGPPPCDGPSPCAD